MKILILLLLAILFVTPAFAQLSQDEQDDLYRLIEFCMLEVPGQKQKDPATAKRALFGTDEERKQLVDDFRRNVLIPYFQSTISSAEQAKAKAQADLTALQGKVK